MVMTHPIINCYEITAFVVILQPSYPVTVLIEEELTQPVTPFRAPEAVNHKRLEPLQLQLDLQALKYDV